MRLNDIFDRLHCVIVFVVILSDIITLVSLTDYSSSHDKNVVLYTLAQHCDIFLTAVALHFRTSRSNDQFSYICHEKLCEQQHSNFQDS